MRFVDVRFDSTATRRRGQISHQKRQKRPVVAAVALHAAERAGGGMFCAWGVAFLIQGKDRTQIALRRRPI